MEDFSAARRRQSFGDLLRLAREVAGWPAQRLARELGVTSQAIRNWEWEKRVPTRERLEQIEALIGSTPGRLVSLVHDDEVPCPNRVDALTAVEGLALDAAGTRALQSVLGVFLAGRDAPSIPDPVDGRAFMTAGESIQEDERLTYDERLRTLALVDLLREASDVPAATS